MHYFNGASFEDIARDLDLTKGRISQLHKRAIERLRTMLKTSGGCDIEM
jgi:RNA polymerase sigma factor for flagellar operon FliA